MDVKLPYIEYYMKKWIQLGKTIKISKRNKLKYVKFDFILKLQTDLYQELENHYLYKPLLFKYLTTAWFVLIKTHTGAHTRA